MANKFKIFEDSKEAVIEYQTKLNSIVETKLINCLDFYKVPHKGVLDTKELQRISHYLSKKKKKLITIIVTKEPMSVDGSSTEVIRKLVLANIVDKSVQLSDIQKTISKAYNLKSNCQWDIIDYSNIC